MTKVKVVFLIVIVLAVNAYAQNDSKKFINELVGRWTSLDAANYSVAVKNEGAFLLVTETTIEESGKSYITQSKIYLDGRIQVDGLKPSAEQAKTLIKKTSLITTYYVIKNGKIKELFKEKLYVKNGNLILQSQVKIGIPFLSAGTTQTFYKITNQ